MQVVIEYLIYQFILFFFLFDLKLYNAPLYKMIDGARAYFCTVVINIIDMIIIMVLLI